MCLLCQITLSQFKTSNLKRHHDTNHSGFSKEFPVGSQLRKTKLKSLKEKLHGQSRVMSLFTKEADLTTEAFLTMWLASEQLHKFAAPKVKVSGQPWFIIYSFVDHEVMNTPII
ncbi:UNVERIFIED_CONTAM: hypothetical protein RMT77_004173 [Armadillidium vulgare]